MQINLMVDSKKYNNKKTILVSFFLLLFVVVLIAPINGAIMYRTSSLQSTYSEDSIANIEEQMTRVDRERRQYQRRLNLLQQNEQRFSKTFVGANISLLAFAVDENIGVEKITTEDDSVLVEGKSLNEDSIFDLVVNLDDFTFIEEARLLNFASSDDKYTFDLKYIIKQDLSPDQEVEYSEFVQTLTD